MIDKRSEKDRRKYELTKEERALAKKIKKLLEQASIAFYNSTGLDTNSAASVSVIQEPLAAASTLSDDITSSSLYGKLKELLGRIRNTAPSAASAQGMSSYSTNLSTVTGDGSEYSGSISTGKLGTVRPSGNVTGNENNIVTPPENEASSTVTNVGRANEEVNKKIENGEESVPSFVNTLNDILAGSMMLKTPGRLARCPTAPRR